MRGAYWNRNGDNVGKGKVAESSTHIVTNLTAHAPETVHVHCRALNQTYKSHAYSLGSSINLIGSTGSDSPTRLPDNMGHAWLSFSPFCGAVAYVCYPFFPRRAATIAKVILACMIKFISAQVSFNTARAT